MIRLTGGTLLIIALVGLQIGVMGGMAASHPSEATVEFDDETFVVHVGGEEVDLCEENATRQQPPAIVERNVTSGVVDLEKLPGASGSEHQAEPVYCQDDIGDSRLANHPANAIGWSSEHFVTNSMTSMFGVLSAIGAPVAQLVYHSPVPDRVWSVAVSGATLLVPLGYIGLLLRRAKVDG
jgi:hypothetical protein